MFIRQFKPFSAPKEWSFINPENGFIFKAPTKEELFHHIQTYRAQNNLDPLEYLEATVENYLCSLPMHSGSCTKTRLKRGVMQFINGGIAILRNLAYNSFATQEEADRRSGICKDCPLNVFPDKTYFVKWSDRIAEQAVGKRKSINHNHLGNCEACGCPLRAKVFYDGKVTLKPEEKEKMQKATSKCWQLEIAK